MDIAAQLEVPELPDGHEREEGDGHLPTHLRQGGRRIAPTSPTQVVGGQQVHEIDVTK